MMMILSLKKKTIDYDYDYYDNDDGDDDEDDPNEQRLENALTSRQLPALTSSLHPQLLKKKACKCFSKKNYGKILFE